MSSSDPLVYQSVRPVGVLRPCLKFGEDGRVFADSLDVMGTAFSCRGHDVLVTCAHVVEQYTNVPAEVGGLLVVGHEGRYARATVDIIDHSHDLAILRPESAEGLNAASGQGLEIATSYPEVGSKVAYAGFPLGTQLLTSNHEPTYAEGVVGASRRDRGRSKVVQITGAVVGGFSGSPITSPDLCGHVIGVLSHSPSKEAGQASIFMAISWEHVAALLKLASS